MWTTVREKVRERSRTTEVMLAGAIVRAVDGDTLVLSHESAPLAKRLTEQRNADVIREALKDALGVNWKIRCEVGAATAAVPAAPKPQAAPAEPEPEPSHDDDEESMLAEAGNDDPPRRAATPRKSRSSCCRPNSARVASTAERAARPRSSFSPAAPAPAAPPSPAQ